jgi:hypothetical protein
VSSGLRNVAPVALPLARALRARPDPLEGARPSFLYFSSICPCRVRKTPATERSKRDPRGYSGHARLWLVPLSVARCATRRAASVRGWRDVRIGIDGRYFRSDRAALAAHHAGPGNCDRCACRAQRLADRPYPAAQVACLTVPNGSKQGSRLAYGVEHDRERGCCLPQYTSSASWTAASRARWAGRSSHSTRVPVGSSPMAAREAVRIRRPSPAISPRITSSAGVGVRAAAPGVAHPSSVEWSPGAPAILEGIGWPCWG